MCPHKRSDSKRQNFQQSQLYAHRSFIAREGNEEGVLHLPMRLQRSVVNVHRAVRYVSSVYDPYLQETRQRISVSRLIRGCHVRQGLAAHRYDADAAGRDRPTVHGTPTPAVDGATTCSSPRIMHIYVAVQNIDGCYARNDSEALRLCDVQAARRGESNACWFSRVHCAGRRRPGVATTPPSAPRTIRSLFAGSIS